MRLIDFVFKARILNLFHIRDSYLSGNTRGLQSSIKMFKKVVIGSALLAAAIADPKLSLHNSALAHETVLQDVSVPYPYQDLGVKRFVSSEPVRNTYYTHDGYQAILVPSAPPAPVGFSVFNLFALIVTYPFVLAKKAIGLLLANIPALLIGVAVVFGVCKLTPVCHKLSHWKSIEDAEIEIRSLATPERIARATDFVQKAIKKFSSMQDNAAAS